MNPGSNSGQSDRDGSSHYDETCLGVWTRRPTDEKKGGRCLGLLFLRTTMKDLPPERSSGLLTVVMQRLSEEDLAQVKQEQVAEEARRLSHRAIQQKHLDSQAHSRDAQDAATSTTTTTATQAHTSSATSQKRATDPGLWTSARETVQDIQDSFSSKEKMDEMWNNVSEQARVQKESLNHVVSVIFSEETLKRAGQLASYTATSVVNQLTRVFGARPGGDSDSK